MQRLYIVIPCFNEEAVILDTAAQVKKKVNGLIEQEVIHKDSKILFVNDGSRDRTWELIHQLHRQDICFCGLNLSRNRGHQNALLAGLMFAKEYADVTISMDADMQDDIDAVDEMLEKYTGGGV